MPRYRPSDNTTLDEPLPHEMPGGAPFSIARAIRCLSQKGGKLDGLEAECSQELAKRVGIPPPVGGFYADWNTRSLSGTSGAGSIFRLPGPMIGILRQKLALAQLGATVLPDLRGGKFALPQQTATVTPSWLPEGTSVGSSNLSITQQVSLEPKTTGGRSQISRTAIASIPDVDQLVINDILGAIAVEIQRVALNGSGVGSEPLGLFQTPAIQLVALGTNGGPPTRAMAIAMERTLGNANADTGALGWVGSPDARSAMRTVLIGSGSDALWSDRDTVLSYRAVATNSVPTGISKGSSGATLTGIMLGNWNDLLIGLWGPATIIVNPYTYATTGYVEIRDCQKIT